jgi:hypothetical protein
MSKLFDRKRIDEATDFIADELKGLLDRNNYKSHMQRRLQEACPAYHSGLTNGETLLATLRALSRVQLEITNDLGSLTHSDYDDDDDDDEIAA